MIETSTNISRYEKIRRHPLFKQEYERLIRMEEGRTYCGHNMEHFLDVARVCYIQVLEEGLPISKDEVYAAGLLHDIGKGLQYECGLPHHLESARIAEEILPECGYTEEEIARICGAIRLHRKPVGDDDPLVRILYLADKKTRLCFSCSEQEGCNWPEEKMTLEIVF